MKTRNAALGALVGDHLGHRDAYAVAVTRPLQRCQTAQSDRQILTGYQVTYFCNGRNTTVVLPYDPGARVAVEVGIAGSAAQNRRDMPAVVPVAYYERQQSRIRETRLYRRHGRNDPYRND